MVKHQFNLIENIYSIYEAKEVLLSLINDKIKFINQKIFSRQVRFGEKNANLERRVIELMDEKEQLLDKLKPFMDGDYDVEIECKVILKINKRLS